METLYNFFAFRTLEFSETGEKRTGNPVLLFFMRRQHFPARVPGKSDFLRWDGISLPSFHDGEDKGGNGGKNADDIADGGVQMQATIDDRSHHKVADTDEGQDGCRNGAHPMLFPVSDQIGCCGPQNQARQGLVADSEIFPDGGKIHLAAEEGDDEDRQTEEKSLADWFLVFLEEISDSEPETSESSVS